jgi:hypothetical protein
MDCLKVGHEYDFHIQTIRFNLPISAGILIGLKVTTLLDPITDARQMGPVIYPLLVLLAVRTAGAEDESKLPPGVELRTSRHYEGDWRLYEHAKPGDFAEYDEGRKADTRKRREIVEIGDHYVVVLTTTTKAGQSTQSAVKILFKNPKPLTESKNKKASHVRVHFGDKDYPGELVEVTAANRVISRHLYCEAVPFEGLVWGEGGEGDVHTKLVKYSRDGSEFTIKEKPAINVAPRPDQGPKYESPVSNAKVAKSAETKTDKPAADRKTTSVATWKGKSVAEWAAQLQDNDSGKRAEAAVSLQALGPKALDAAPDLIRALKDKEPNVRSGAALALGKIGASEAVSDIAVLLQDKMGNVKIDAARALALFKEDAAPALPLLLKVLKQDKEPARAGVIDVVREIGPKARAAVPVLIEFVQGKDAVLARGALGALASIVPDAREAVPAITEATKSTDPLTAGSAGFALWKIDPDVAQSLQIPKPKSLRGKR